MDWKPQNVIRGFDTSHQCGNCLPLKKQEVQSVTETSEDGTERGAGGPQDHQNGPGPTVPPWSA